MLLVSLIFFPFWMVSVFALDLLRSKRLWGIILTLNFLYLLLVNSSSAVLYFVVLAINYNLVRSKLILKAPVFYSSLLLNLGILFFFKSGHLFPDQSWLQFTLPLGLSYFLFQQIGYLVDSYWARGAQEDFGLKEFAAASTFFANIASGPLASLKTLSVKVTAIDENGASLVSRSATLLLWGTFKKLVVADNLLPYVTAVFDPKSVYTGSEALIGVFINKYQIFANFSGYTDMALGMALLFGIELPENFKRPFNSLTIREFWKKWHMSLTAWINRYVFFPLSLKTFRYGQYPALTAAFLAFALWHDFNLPFFFYGLVQVILIFFSNQLEPFFERLSCSLKEISPNLLSVFNFLRKLWLYIFVLSLPATLFRSRDLESVIGLWRRLLDTSPAVISREPILHVGNFNFLWVFALILLVELGEYLKASDLIFARLARFNFYQKATAVFLFVMVFTIFAQYDNDAPFIYSLF